MGALIDNVINFLTGPSTLFFVSIILFLFLLTSSQSGWQGTVAISIACWSTIAALHVPPLEIARVR